MDTWVLRMCRRSSARQLVAWALGLAIIVLIGATSASYWRRFLLGPRDLSAPELGRILDPDGSPDHWVRVYGTGGFETGIEEYAVKTQNGVEVSRSVAARFYGLQVGERVLIVRSPRALGTSVTGTLKPMPEEFQRHFFRTAEEEALRPRVYPFLLDVTAFRTAGYWGIGLTAAFLALLAWLARPAWRRFRDPETHPVSVLARTWGDPVTIAAEVERELKGPDVRRAGPWRVTSRYLVFRSLFGFGLLRVRDLLWAYKKVTKHSVNFIPTGKTYAVMAFCYGGAAELPGSQQRCDELLQSLTARAPWAVFGYAKEIEQAFKQDPRGFGAAVERRRREQGA